MKKLALAGIVSILATVALSGCMSVPEEEDQTPADETTPIVEDIQEEETDVEEDLTEDEESETSAYEGTSIPLKFEYPSNMHIETSDSEIQNGAYYITLGEEYTESGYLLPLIRIEIEKDDHSEAMGEINGPNRAIINKCEDEDWADTVWNCKTDKEWTSYFSMVRMGDIGFEKVYLMENEVEGWSIVEVRLDLLTDDLVAGFEDAESILEFVKDYELDEEQLRRIELTDTLVESLTLK